MAQRIFDEYSPTRNNQYIPSDRLRVTRGVNLPDGERDCESGDKTPNEHLRRRLQSKQLELERLEKEERLLSGYISRENAKGGVRVTVRCCAAVIGVLLFLCGISLLIQCAELQSSEMALNALMADVTNCEKENGTLKSDIEAANDEGTITHTVTNELGLIHCTDESAIHLTAENTRLVDESVKP